MDKEKLAGNWILMRLGAIPAIIVQIKTDELPSKVPSNYPTKAGRQRKTF
jgi:hypothetical protein